MALYDSGFSSSVSPAVQRREQLLRAHALPAADSVDTEQEVPEIRSEAPRDEVKSDAQAPASTSEKIALEVLTAGPLAHKRFSLFRKGESRTTSNLREALRPATGGGGPENPIYVTIAERVWYHLIRLFLSLMDTQIVVTSGRGFSGLFSLWLLVPSVRILI